MTFEQPDVIPVTDRLYRLMDNYSVVIQSVSGPGRLMKITIPKGYQTDLASIPRFIWSLFGLTPDGLYRGAAVVHDFIYGQHIKGTDHCEVIDQFTGTIRFLSRKQCDDIFKELIHDSGEDSWKEQAMYNAVRIFGRFYF